MAITDKLRHSIKGAEQLYGRECPRLTAMCDRIDEAHEEAIQREHEMAYDKGYDEAMKSCENWAAGHEDEMAKSGWYQALDADKQPIHIGDVMVDRNFPDAKYTVVGIGKDKFFTRDAYGELYEHTASHTASFYIHYKQSTVEDVLCELLDKVNDDRAGQAEIIAEYAAKLQLKED